MAGSAPAEGGAQVRGSFRVSTLPVMQHAAVQGGGGVGGVELQRAVVVGEGLASVRPEGGVGEGAVVVAAGDVGRVRRRR